MIYNKDILKAYTDTRVKCKCGHKSIIPHNIDRIICWYCGHWLYREAKIEFKYKLKETMKG